MPHTKAQTVSNIRQTLGRTSTELAKALGISEKVLADYEKQRKPVPTRVMLQLLVLLALHRRPSMQDTPCWEITHCRPEDREQCACFTVGQGQMCWFVGRKTCVQANPAAKNDLLPCMSCKVIQRLLKGS